MAARDIRQRVELDTGRSVEELRQVEEAARDTDRAVEEVDASEIDVDTDAALRRLAELRSQAKALAEERTTLVAELDARGVDTGVGQVKRELDSIDTTLDVSLDVDEGGVNATTSAVGDVFDEIGIAGADTAIGISQAFNDAAEQAKAAFGPDSGIAQALSAIGPLGTAALGAAVGGVLYWLQQSQAAQDAYNAKVQEWVELLEEANGQLEEASLRRLLDTLSDDDIRAANTLGLSYQDLATILSGGTVPAFEDALAVIPQVADALGVEAALAFEVAGRFADLNGVTGDVNERTVELADAAGYLQRQLSGEETALRDATVAYEGRREIVERTIEQVGSLDQALEELPEEVVTAIKPFLDEEAVAAAEERIKNREAVPVQVIPEFTGPIAPGYTPTIKVDVSSVVPTDLVAAGRVIDRALRDYYRSAGLGEWRAV